MPEREEDLSYERARLLMQEGKLKDAQQAIIDAIATNPGNANFYATAAIITRMRGRWKDSIKFADKGLAIDPRNITCIYARAASLHRLGQGKEAIRILESECENDPQDLFCGLRGYLLLMNGRATEAIPALKKALGHDPTQTWARGLLIDALNSRNPIYRAYTTMWKKMLALPFLAFMALLLSVHLVLSSLGHPVMALGIFAGAWLLEILIRQASVALLSFEELGKALLPFWQVMRSRFITLTLIAALAINAGLFTMHADDEAIFAANFALVLLGILSFKFWSPRAIYYSRVAQIWYGILFVLSGTVEGAALSSHKELALVFAVLLFGGLMVTLIVSLLRKATDKILKRNQPMLLQDR